MFFYILRFNENGNGLDYYVQIVICGFIFEQVLTVEFYDQG